MNARNKKGATVSDVVSNSNAPIDLKKLPRLADFHNWLIFSEEVNRLKSLLKELPLAMASIGSF